LLFGFLSLTFASEKHKFFMMVLKRLSRGIPYWAYLFILFVIFVNVLYLVYKLQRPESGAVLSSENGQWIYKHIVPEGAADKAGIKQGDVLISVNSYTTEEWMRIQKCKAGDTVTVSISRNDQLITVRLTYTIRNAEFLWFYVVLLIVMCLYVIASLVLLYKKPHDRSVWLFFLYMLCVAICHNGVTIGFPEFLASLTAVAFIFCACILVPILVHFHLLFPRPSKLIIRFPRLPVVLYIPALFLFIIFSTFEILSNYFGTDYYNSNALGWNRVLLYWITLNYFLALITVIYQYREIKDTLARNQLLIIIIGTTFGQIAPIAFAFFPESLTQEEQYFQFIWESVSGIGTLILVTCILIAIFRYRIWNTEIFIRKALLYLAATIVIILSYFILLYLVAQFTHKQTNLSRFLILALSVIIFLVTRDWIQILIDRIFHRESYDSTTVVSDFEEKLAGIYRTDELKAKISQGLDEIFHFKTFMLNLKNSNRKYQPEYAIGLGQLKFDEEIETAAEFEKKLTKTKVFSPGELEQKLSFTDAVNAELIVPLVKENQPYGFFVCGPKKSEKTYSMQDIRVLSLIAKRVIALFHTASLYQKDLDRQLMLERERARISQDMHDDVGASLTRISILSDLAKNKTELSGETKQWLGQISETSREVTQEMGQIIWALNPKNDTLEGLVAYIRRFVNEYLEPTDLTCNFDFPVELPVRALSVEVRRNVYLVVREALHNVVKHSGANQVWISINTNEHGFKIVIKDDGSGFDPGTLKFPGNGLINMRKRISDIGGDFHIHTEFGKGTEIGLVI
jgi:signal transduction histidine kinase